MAKQKYKGLVIVESPAKAKKINSYLGRDYKVLASMGHVRDLPESAADIPEEVKKEPWSRLGVNVSADFEPLYVIPAKKKKLISELKSALKEADELILATDEDREGESIGWHLAEVLKPKIPVKRMVFSEITKQAIQEAIRNPRDLDHNLVEAQETRRVLDRLYGYTLSPLLWKKVARGLSAGRVQSVAVRLIVLRELERRAFRSATWWDLKVQLQTPQGGSFEAELSAVGGRRVALGKDFDENTGKLKPTADVLLLDEQTVGQLRDRLTALPERPAPPGFHVGNIEEREQVRRPYAPFTTSTLQQESNRKLGLSARETMQIAQRLYEEGLITYMRTDSVSLSTEAVSAARRCIEERYGKDYLSPQIRSFETKSKGAQEAHEAIRPAGTEMKTGEEHGLAGRELQLYSLIWKRTVACQMADARLRFRTITIQADDAEFKATGRQIEFPGFFRAYVEGVDDPAAALDDQEQSLPAMAVRDPLKCLNLDPVSHVTQPPARYTEATLIRALEADGIGRPSTYASIIGTIQDRGYVVKVSNQLRPTFTAMAVTRLLEKNFPQLVDEQFTASMEQTLDDIATGEAHSTPYLREFYSGQTGLDQQVKNQEENIDPREACTIDLDGLSSRIRVGKFGPYLVKEQDGTSMTASLPNDIAPADITNEMADELLKQKQQGPRSIGTHPTEGVPMYALLGPFGPYLQLGDAVEGGPKPKRVSLPKGADPQAVTFDQAVELLQLPRTVGVHPETGKPVTAGIGRFGPYVFHEGTGFKSLPKGYDVLTIDLPTSVELLKQKRVRGGATPIKELGAHPEDQQPVQVFDGKYGQYVKHGDVNATLPKETVLDTLTLADVLPLLAERAAATGKGKGKGRGKKTAAPKAAARKTAGTAAAPKKSAKKGTKAAPSAARKSAKAVKATKRPPASRKNTGDDDSAPIDPDTLPF
ncbi:MAG: type I DNA topoisomerase [Planctomycetaceae bacterium]